MEKALAEKIYARMIDGGFYRPPVGSIYYRPNYYPAYYHPRGTYYYLPNDLEASIGRVLGFHDYINRYELTHDVINRVSDPAVVEILGAMYDVMQQNRSKKEASANNTGAKQEVAKPALYQQNNSNMVHKAIFAQEMANLKGISEEAMNRLVDQALVNAKNKPPEDKDATTKDA